MKEVKEVSLRSTLHGDVFIFLEKEGMSCAETQKGIVELVSQLAHYREEGKELFPEIFIVDELDTILQVLRPCSWHKIGDGPKSPQTMLKALKKCAPLTEGNWSILIHRTENEFEFGVCQTGMHSLSVPIADILIDETNPELKAIYIHQVAERLIEMKGAIADSLMISFSSKHQSESPLTQQQKFVNLVVSKMPERYKEQAIHFFSSILLEALQRGHGTLACVIDTSKKEVPKKLQDGHLLSERISISNTIQHLIEKESLISNRELEGCKSLIIGMLNSDGITVFTNSGEVVAYNIFIKHSKKITTSQTSGGARSRTYLTLCEYIGNGVEGAYIQSQDGDIKVKSRNS